MTALATNYRIFDLPWTPDDDESQRLKKTARALLLVFAALGIAIPLIPMTERPPPPPLPATAPAPRRSASCAPAPTCSQSSRAGAAPSGTG